MPGPVPAGRRGAASAEEHLSFGVEARVDELELTGRVVEGDADDVGAPEGDHLPEVLVVHGVDGVEPEAGGEPTVEGGRGAAALDVAEDDGAGLGPGADLDL